MMPDKKYYVENRESWKSEYGSLLKNLPGIGSIVNLINSYIDLENKPLVIMEYGCAYGYYLQMLKFINPGHKVYGIDIALDAVNYAKDKLGEDRIFWQSCGEKIPLPDDSVNLISCFEMVEHIADNTVLINMFKECNRLLKRDGYMFIKTPNCSLRMKLAFSLAGETRIFKGSDHPNPLDERKLRRLVEPYLLVQEVIYFFPILTARFLKFIKLTSSMSKLKIAPSLIFVLRKRG
jgi:2-polyprenyl-3-methyl-5-hydroxy-6-metoxy-1,4-benzoquinol methylase